ncbi:MAG: TetR-like C-terminal domain-containing protein [Solibacillus sp.]
MKKEDPRAIRTQEMIRNAIIALLEAGTPIHKLSVQMITKQAQLNRTTFYLHYQDVDDCMERFISDVLDELTNHVQTLAKARFDEQKQLTIFLDFLYAQRHYLLLLIQNEAFERHLFHSMRELITERREQVIIPSSKIRINPDLKTASIVGIIMWWLKSGFHLNSETIAKEIHLMYRH